MIKNMVSVATLTMGMRDVTMVLVLIVALKVYLTVIKIKCVTRFSRKEHIYVPLLYRKIKYIRRYNIYNR